MFVRMEKRWGGEKRLDKEEESLNSTDIFHLSSFSLSPPDRYADSCFIVWITCSLLGKMKRKR